MPEIAARMVRMIRQIQPYGPYLVAGRSFGGNLAFEAAAQLSQQGLEVSFVGLFDARYSAGNPTFDEPPSEENDQLMFEVEHWATQEVLASRALRDLKTSCKTMSFPAMVSKCRALGLLPDHLRHLSDEEIQVFLSREYAIYLADINYHPSALPIPIDLFAAQDDEFSDPLRGWSSVMGKTKIRVHPVPGTHATMFDPPNVQALCKILRDALPNPGDYGASPPGSVGVWNTMTQDA
jgi:thioesterase domain-containing protein